jgi:hypothetical protein
MRLDLLKTANVDRSTDSSTQYQMVRGRLTDLLLINTTTWHYKDKITIKLRHEGGLRTIVDRVSALVLAQLCDLKQGMTTTGSPNYIGTPDGNNNENNGLIVVNQGIRFYLNAFTLPLGHITLNGSAQLEITIDSARMDQQTDAAGKAVAQPVGQIKISAIERKTVTDFLLCYDVSNDLEAQQSQIREIYLVGKNNVSFFKDGTTQQNATTYGLPVAKDITIKLGVDGEDSENDIEAYGALTAITGQLTYQPNNIIRLFQDLESLPASVYVKVYGDNASDSAILYIREDQIPHMVAASIYTAVDKEQRRIEVLEQNEPEKARALIQSGKIASSAALAAAKDDFVPAIGVPSK